MKPITKALLLMMGAALAGLFLLVSAEMDSASAEAVLGNEAVLTSTGSGDRSSAGEDSSSAPPSPIVMMEDELRWGDHLAGLLHRNSVESALAHKVLDLFGKHLELRRIPVGTKLRIQWRGERPRLFELQPPKSLESQLIELSSDGELTYRHQRAELDTVLRLFEGSIEESFYRSFEGSGGSIDLAVKFIEIFQFTFYFVSETRRGDSYRFLAEELRKDGEIVGYGRILAARYHGMLDSLTAVWYPLEESEWGGEYFDSLGYSFRRDLLRVPFPAARITSLYGIRRHPITGRVKMHHGVDLAARRGTPVVAAGSGKVTQVGRGHVGYGNWVHIDHKGTGFETRYGHFSRIAPGIRKGTWVKQGDVIGYVGSTGHATGPHLHYEVFRDGRRINPLKVKGSPVKRIEGDQLANFLTTQYLPWTMLMENPGCLPGERYFGPPRPGEELLSLGE